MISNYGDDALFVFISTGLALLAYLYNLQKVIDNESILKPKIELLTLDKYKHFLDRICLHRDLTRDLTEKKENVLRTKNLKYVFNRFIDSILNYLVIFIKMLLLSINKILDKENYFFFFTGVALFIYSLLKTQKINLALDFTVISSSVLESPIYFTVISYIWLILSLLITLFSLYKQYYRDRTLDYLFYFEEPDHIKLKYNHNLKIKTSLRDIDYSIFSINERSFGEFLTKLVSLFIVSGLYLTSMFGVKGLLTAFLLEYFYICYTVTTKTMSKVLLMGLSYLLFVPAYSYMENVKFIIILCMCLSLLNYIILKKNSNLELSQIVLYGFPYLILVPHAMVFFGYNGVLFCCFVLYIANFLLFINIDKKIPTLSRDSLPTPKFITPKRND